jgi:hypothetical protein
MISRRHLFAVGVIGLTALCVPGLFGAPPSTRPSDTLEDELRRLREHKPKERA